MSPKLTVYNELSQTEAVDVKVDFCRQFLTKSFSGESFQVQHENLGQPLNLKALRTLTVDLALGACLEDKREIISN